jgi:multidrug resistance efflux pump
MKRTVNIILPLAGITFAVYWVVVSSRQGVVASPERPPATSEYANTVAGAGIVESSSRDINVAPQTGGKVIRVFVTENQSVGKGQPLYQLDDREQRAQYAAASGDLARAVAAVRTAEMQLANAKVAVAGVLSNQKSLEASLADLAAQAHANEQLYKYGGIAYITYNASARAAEGARQRVEQAKSQVEEAKAQVAIAESQLAENRAGVGSYRGRREQLVVEMKQLCVTAPLDGRVLQVNILPGEYVPSNPATAPILFGSTDILQVRVDIDETNASRVKANTKAVAHLKGDSTKRFPLVFLRIDPYIVPKRNLTGDNTERVDVRVLQVIYRFQPPPFPVYVGQQLDVFIANE